MRGPLATDPELGDPRGVPIIDGPSNGEYEELPDLFKLYDCIIKYLQEGGEVFIKSFEIALEVDDGTPYRFANEPQYDPFLALESAPDHSNIIHRMVEAVRDQRLHGPYAGRLTEVLLQVDRTLVKQRAENPKSHEIVTPKCGKNPLELASSDPNCLPIVKAICEHGMVRTMTTKEDETIRLQIQRAMPMPRDNGVVPPEPEPKSLSLKDASHWILSKFTSSALKSTNFTQNATGDPWDASGAPEALAILELKQGLQEVVSTDGYKIYVYYFWTDFVKDREDSCLHIAVKSGNNKCARYFLERISLTGETKSVLGRRDCNGLTLLHLAVDFTRCTDAQVDFVRHLISYYPDALGMPSGSMVFGDTSGSPNTQDVSRSSFHHSRQVDQSQDRTPRMKENLAAYKYFLESREQVNNSKSKSQNAQPFSRRRGGLQASKRLQNGDRTVLQASKKLTGGDNCAAEKMADLLKLSCMRHFGRDRAKLTQLLDSKNQIHFDLNPRTVVTPQLLDYIQKMKLEPYLQYVFIPNLRVVGMKNKTLEEKPWWESSGRKDYAYIFEWLRVTAGVRKIIRIVVQDDPIDFHSDELIEHSLKGFDVEEWRWKKWDMCSDTILEAAPDVRIVDLYWSGNKAILRSWAAADGLVLLKRLEEINIMRTQGTESRRRTKDIIAKFQRDLEFNWRERWRNESPRLKPPIISVELSTSPKDITHSLSEKELEDRGHKQRWLKCTENFALILDRWFNNELSKRDSQNNSIRLAEDKEIKVAIIDDGVDVDRDDMIKSVEAGETFFDNQGQWPGHYTSSQGHGHLMACLIRQLCPRVKLYIAKLNEVWIDGKAQITAESAASAIKWAREMNVDIISMSWTIENVEEPARGQLKKEVNDAFQDGILLFCACDDQGNLSDHPYPAKVDKEQFIKIGSATALGTRHKGTNETFFDYIAPGSGSEEILQGVQDYGLVPPASALFGSSIATARCAGLAAMILQCIVLVYHPDNGLKLKVRQLEQMKKMFGRMVEEKDNNKYIKVWNVFEQAMNRPGMGDDMEGNIIETIAGEFMGKLDWVSNLPKGPPRIA